MVLNRSLIFLTALIATLLLSMPSWAVPVTGVDLDELNLGPRIVGPVGSEVNVSLIDARGNSRGDLISSVACPVGFADCVPSTNPPGTRYTYLHQVTPGVDTANDAPFPQPPLVALDGVRHFATGFPVTGFIGRAGYSFGEAEAALGADGKFALDLSADRELTWTVAEGSGWESGETITFFWQTTQPPSGPGGVYTFSNSGVSARGAGPLPMAIPLPPSWLLLLFGLGVPLLGRATPRSNH